MNIPNLLTLLRFPMAIAFGWFLLQYDLISCLWAIGFFMLACLTDYFDGYLARKWGQVSVFGQIADPLADKVLTLTAFFILTHKGVIPLWMMVVVAMREILITLLRFCFVCLKRYFPSESLGKAKTVLQIMVISMALAHCALTAPPAMMDGSSLEMFVNMIHIVMFAVVVITVYSGLTILWVMARAQGHDQ